MKGHGKICFVFKKAGGFRATSLPTYDYYILYTTLPHNLIKEKKLLDLTERTSKEILKNVDTLDLTCNDETAIFTSTDHRGYKL